MARWPNWRSLSTSRNRVAAGIRRHRLPGILAMPQRPQFPHVAAGVLQNGLGFVGRDIIDNDDLEPHAAAQRNADLVQQAAEIGGFVVRRTDDRQQLGRPSARERVWPYA